MISNTNKLISERGEICKDADIDDSVSESVGPQTSKKILNWERS